MRAVVAVAFLVCSLGYSAAQIYWTQWRNRDRPSGDCDCEFIGADEVVCENNLVVHSAQCRLSSNRSRPFTSPPPAWVPNVFVAGYDCSKLGLYCANVEQVKVGCQRRFPPCCEDYEIRYQCGPDNSVCKLSGDPHYVSFDGTQFDFQGNCKYVLVKDCANSTFVIEVEQVLTSPGSSVAITKAFTIRLNGNVYHLQWGPLFYVGATLTPVPAGGYSNADVSVTVSGSTIVVVLVNYGVKLEWVGGTRAKVTAEKRWNGLLCGLCGSNNGNDTDDFTGRNGVLHPAPSPFGDTWKVPGGPPRCSPITIGTDACRDLSPPKIAAIEAMCDTMEDNEFTACADAMNMAGPLADCKTELCDCGGPDPMCMCTTLEVLALTCDAAGFPVADSWWTTYKCRGFCYYDGVVRADGSTWTDGAKTCVCNDSVVTCTTPDKDCCCPRCPAGWLTFGDRCFFGQSCRFVEASANTARDRCVYMGAKPARVLNPADAMYFLSNVFGFTGRYMFVDGRDEGAEGAWVNDDGTSVAPLTWHTSGGNTAAKDCMYVTTEGGTVYRHAIRCDQDKMGKKWGFVCERPSE